MESEKRTRARSSNFTPHEEEVLWSLVEKHQSIVESKKMSAAAWRKKRMIWDIITEEFCGRCRIYRTSTNLKAKYTNMKTLKMKQPLKNFSTSDSIESHTTLGGMFTSQVTSTDEGVETEDIMIKEETFEMPEETYETLSAPPKSFKKKKQKRTIKRHFDDEFCDDELLKVKKKFYEHEELRAQERHQMEMKELQLKVDLLNYELQLKRLELEKQQKW